MEVEAKFIEGRTFLTKGESNHWVALDTAKEKGGGGAVSTPMEMVLMGLASCTGLDVVVILEKRRVKLDDFNIKISAERAESHPRVYTKIHLSYQFTSSDLTGKDAERAIQLSQDKYCSVSKMLDKTAEITYDYEVRRP